MSTSSRIYQLLQQKNQQTINPTSSTNYSNNENSNDALPSLTISKTLIYKSPIPLTQCKYL